MRKSRRGFWIAGGPVLLLLAAAALAIAGPVSTPHTFTPGTVADANEVNENFAALEAAINDNDTRIEANQTGVGTNQANIAGNATAIAAHGVRLTTNETDIATNATNIATNTADIAANAASIATNVTDIATNVTDIATNVTDIAANATDITSNETDIDDHETRIGAIETGSPVSGLDADKLDGFHANGLVRATYTGVTSGADNWYNNSYATFATKSVTIPSSGILLIWAKTEASWDIDSTAGSYSWLQTRITVSGTEVGTTGTQEYFDNAIGLDMSVLPLSVAVPVTAGSLTVALEGRIYAGSAYVYLGPRSLLTLFVPFGNAGTQGALSPNAPAAPGSPVDTTPTLPPIPSR